MMKAIDPVLQELNHRLRDLYGDRLSKLVLFGSQARGDAEEDSDIDVLVVLKGSVRPLKEIAETGEHVARISAENGVVINTLFVSLKENDARQEPVIINAAREGRLVTRN